MREFFADRVKVKAALNKQQQLNVYNWNMALVS